MPFYAKPAKFGDYAGRLSAFRAELRRKAKIMSPEDENGTELYLYDENIESIYQIFNREYTALLASKHVNFMPFFDINGKPGYLIELINSDHNDAHTVSSGFVRLPKLSYLITLTPEDFFALLKIVSTAKITNNVMTLFPAAVGIPNLDSSSIGLFFRRLKTNYRMNGEYANSKWTKIADIKAVADLEQTRDNQLSAVQYLTALQNNDLVYFPVESMIALDIGLDWDQISDEYVVPPTDGPGPLNRRTSYGVR